MSRSYFLLIPLVLLFVSPALARIEVRVLFPDNGEIIYGFSSVKWASLCDPPDTVTYKVEYSVNAGSSWNTIDEGTFYEDEFLTPHEVPFDTSGIDKSNMCLVRVTIRNSRGEENRDTSDGFFTIQNVLSPPILISPADKSTIRESMPTLTWMNEESPWEIENHWIDVSTEPTFRPERTYRFISGKFNFFTVDRNLKDGIYYWRVKCVDNRGVESDWSQVFSFEVFTYAPVIFSAVPESEFLNKKRVSIEIRHQNINQIAYSLDQGATWSEWRLAPASGQTLDVEFPEDERDGVKTIWLRGKSPAGKLSDIKPVKIVLDTKPPVTLKDLSGYLGEKGYRGSVVVTIKAIDPDSGVGLIQYRINGGRWENGSTFVISTEGTHTVEYMVWDRAGNVARDYFEVTVYVPISPVPYMVFFGASVGVAVGWVVMWKKGLPAIQNWRRQRQLRSKWFQELVGWTGEEAPKEEKPREKPREEKPKPEEAVEERPLPPRISPIVQSYKEMLRPIAEEKMKVRRESESLSNLLRRLDEIKKKEK